MIEAKHTIEALQQVEKDKIAELEEQRKTIDSLTSKVHVYYIYA